LSADLFHNLELQDVLSQRALHIQFERFSISNAVAQQIKVLQAAPDFIAAPNDWQTASEDKSTKSAAKNKPAPKIDKKPERSYRCKTAGVAFDITGERSPNP
jgi:hypothetical protein